MGRDVPSFSISISTPETGERPGFPIFKCRTAIETEDASTCGGCRARWQAKMGARIGAAHGICLCIHRPEDQGTWRLARENARESARYHTSRQTLRSWKSGSGQGDITWYSRLVPRRHRLHGRDIQERRQDDICQGSGVEGPLLKPRRASSKRAG